MRIMALDIGTERVGIALSDPFKILASPYKVIKMEGNEDLISQIRKEVEANQVEKIVVGMPYKLNKGSSIQTEKVKELVGYMKENLNIQIDIIDERFTTKLAENIMLEADTSRARRKQKIDKLAASLILQTYLDLNRHVQE